MSPGERARRWLTGRTPEAVSQSTRLDQTLDLTLCILNNGEKSAWPGVQTQEERARWLACRSSGSTEKVILRLPEGRVVSVLPLWVAVHQSLDGGLAR